MSPYHYWRKLDKTLTQQQTETLLAVSSQDDDIFDKMLEESVADLGEFFNDGWPGLYTMPISSK